MKYTVAAPGGVGPASSLIEAVDLAMDLSDQDIEVAVFRGARGIEEKIAAFRGGKRIYPVASAEDTLPQDESIPTDIRAEMMRIESEIIERAIQHSNGNKSAAAEMLGMKRSTLVYRLRIGKSRQIFGSFLADPPAAKCFFARAE